MWVPAWKKKRAQRQPAYAIIILYLAKVSILIFGGMAELADASRLGRGGSVHVGSSPTIPTKIEITDKALANELQLDSSAEVDTSQ